jgi:DNA-binding transcriptional regulator YdaS (Cro superfamily)
MAMDKSVGKKKAAARKFANERCKAAELALRGLANKEIEEIMDKLGVKTDELRPSGRGATKDEINDLINNLGLDDVDERRFRITPLMVAIKAAGGTETVARALGISRPALSIRVRRWAIEHWPIGDLRKISQLSGMSIDFVTRRDLSGL